LSFNAQLKSLRILEEKYLKENSDLQNKNMDEGNRNCDLSAHIHDASMKI